MRYLYFFLAILLGLLSHSDHAWTQSTYTLTDSSINYTYPSLTDSIPDSKTISTKMDSAGQVSWLTISKWDEASDRWIGDSRSKTYVNQLDIISFYYRWKWDPDLDDWYLYTSYVAEMDGSGNVTDAIQYFWDTGMERWVGYSWETASFDSSGNKLVETRYQWNKETGEWANDVKLEFKYDAAARVIERVTYEGNLKTAFWNEISRQGFSYEYDEEERVSASVEMGWDRNTEEWKMQFRNEFLYDTASRLLLKTGFRWSEANGWNLTTKDEFTYDSKGNQLLHLASSWVNESWIGSEKQEYTYDDLGNQTMEATYQNNYGNYVEWIGDNRVDKTYDALGNMTGYVLYSWSFEAGAWEGLRQHKSWWDGGNRLVYSTSEIWDPDTLEWMKYNSTLDSYPDTLYRTIRARYLMENAGPDSSLQKKEFHYARGHFYNAKVDLCEGESYMWQGQVINKAGFYQDDFKTSLGADSIYTLDLRVHPVPASFEITQIEETYFICQGQSLHYVAPDNPLVEYTWWSDHGEILSGGDNDTLYFQWLGDGNGELLVRSVNAYGCVSDSVSVMVDIAICDGVEDQFSDRFILYPVPLGDRLFVRTNTPYTLLEVLDLKGVCLISSGMAQQGVDLSHLPEGVYLIRLFDADGILLGIGKVLKD